MRLENEILEVGINGYRLEGYGSIGDHRDIFHCAGDLDLKNFIVCQNGDCVSNIGGIEPECGESIVDIGRDGKCNTMRLYSDEIKK